MSIDDKLREILHAEFIFPAVNVDKEIAQIKQLFKEHGWEESDGNS